MWFRRLNSACSVFLPLCSCILKMVDHTISGEFRVITRRCYEDKKLTQTTTIHDSKPMNKNYTKTSLKLFKWYKLQSGSYESDLIKHEVLGNHSRTPTCLQCDVRLKNLSFDSQAKWNRIKHWILHCFPLQYGFTSPSLHELNKNLQHKSKKMWMPKT